MEFALVSPVLILILFGIIDYGLWFADSITIRQAAAAGARQGGAWADGSAAPWGATATCGSWDPGTSPEIQALGCSIAEHTPTMGEPVHVRIEILNATLEGNAGTTWKAPNAVRVCLLQKHDSISGFVPLPGDMVTAFTDMPIESVSGRVLTAGGQTDLPPGTDWGWCHVP